MQYKLEEIKVARIVGYNIFHGEQFLNFNLVLFLSIILHLTLRISGYIYRSLLFWIHH